MPPRPGHRLDLYVVPEGRRPLPEHAELVARLAEVELGPGRVPAEAAERVVEGGFSSVRVDRPGGVHLYANGQGGFRVSCPASGDSIVPAFSKALSAWRQGGERALICPSCGDEHALEAVDFRPAAAFGSGALVLADVQDARLRPEGHALLEEILGPFTVVGTRR